MRPVLKRKVCGDGNRLLGLIATVDHFKEQVCGSRVVGEVADLINAQKTHAVVVSESCFEARWGVDTCEFVEHR